MLSSVFWLLSSLLSQKIFLLVQHGGNRVPIKALVHDGGNKATIQNQRKACDVSFLNFEF
jgi:hypothetical protein